MSISIAEARAFIEDAKKYREEWLRVADQSWRELKRRNKVNKSATSKSKTQKYPAWYSIHKIRQPLLLSRIGIPIGKDTTQDGNDNVGATAAMCLERLAVNLAKTFDFFDAMASARDDFLATNFGQVRAYYEREEVKKQVKEYISPVKVGNDMMFVDSAGQPVESDDIGQDDEGYFIEHEKVVDVENERVCLEPLLYKHVYVDPDVRRWSKVKRLAFEEYYSVPEFKQIFGTQAYVDLAAAERKAGEDEASPKKQSIKVYEYWDCYEQEVYWFAENGSDFLKPRKYLEPNRDDYLEGETSYGLYDLEKFFPCPKPLLMNTSTDEFWPTPEYIQIKDTLDDVHTLFSRMIALTKAIRARLLFDNNVDGLQAALHEAREGDAFGVPNLAQALSGVGGSLDRVVQYIPVEALVNALTQIYQALENRLNTIYKLTGTSDLLQGLITDTTQRTFGERQMLEKYALNQLADPQRIMQEFVRDCYQLICEVAIKNFKDASLDVYIMPATLPDDHKERYRAALGMLKENTKRFRIELETDSTIALNEQYDKGMRIELTNTLTQSLEKAANIAQQSPALIIPVLHSMKYLIQGFRQGKMFQNEVSSAIDNVIKQAEEAAQSAVPPFNKDEVMAQLKKAELDAKNQIEMAKLQSGQQLEVAKLQQNERLANLEAQLTSFKAQADMSKAQTTAQIAYTKANTDAAIAFREIALAEQELMLKRDQLMIELQKIQDESQREQMRLMLEQSVAASEVQLKQAKQQLEEYYGGLDLQEKMATEQRLQAEHQLNEMETQIRMAAQVKEITTPEQAPLNLTIEAPKPTKKKQEFQMKRDKYGNLTSVKAKNTEAPQGGE